MPALYPGIDDRVTCDVPGATLELVEVVVTAGVVGVAVAGAVVAAAVVAGAVVATVVVAGVAVVAGAVDIEVAGADGEVVEGIVAGGAVDVDVVLAGGHGPYIPPHNCAKPGIESITNKNARKANLDKETLNIASISSQPIG